MRHREQVAYHFETVENDANARAHSTFAATAAQLDLLARDVRQLKHIDEADRLARVLSDNGQEALRARLRQPQLFKRRRR